MDMRVRVRVDRGRCVGTAMCVAVAPNVFEIDNEGKAIVLVQKPQDRERLTKAAEECPTQAVILEDSETNEQLFP